MGAEVCCAGRTFILEIPLQSQDSPSPLTCPGVCSGAWILGALISHISASFPAACLVSIFAYNNLFLADI